MVISADLEEVVMSVWFVQGLVVMSADLRRW